MQEPTVEPFGDLIAEAIEAFSLDASYAVRVCENANTIRLKRSVWSARILVREAASVATVECAKSRFTCAATSPCGIGPGCRYAEGVFAKLTDVPSIPVKGNPSRVCQRPQQSVESAGYSTEGAIRPLMDRPEWPAMLAAAERERELNGAR